MPEEQLPNPQEEILESLLLSNHQQGEEANDIATASFEAQAESLETLKDLQSTAEHQLQMQELIRKGIVERKEPEQVQVAIEGDPEIIIVKGEKGDKGDKGEKGDKGDKGEKGDNPTPEDIKTAVEAFLPVVRDGRDGIDGINGRDGIDGKDADPFAVAEALKYDAEFVLLSKGEKGADGKNGTNGKDGRDGKDLSEKDLKKLEEKLREDMIKDIDKRAQAFSRQVSKTYDVADLGDVVLNNVTNGQALVYDATLRKWKNGSVSGGLELQTDGTPNGDQTLLNLVAGTNITLTDDGFGGVTIDATGGSTFIGCRVYKASGQSYSGSTLTAHQFDTESFDTDTMHDNVTNNTRVTFTTAGKYLIYGVFVTTSNAIASAGLRLNGTTYIANSGVGNAGGGFNNGLTLSTIYEVSASDYVELMGTFNASITSSGGAGGCQLGAYKIG